MYSMYHIKSYLHVHKQGGLWTSKGILNKSINSRWIHFLHLGYSMVVIPYSYAAIGLFTAEIMRIYAESRTSSRANWHRENSREFVNFWKGLRTMLYSVNEEMYLPKWMQISDLRKVFFHVFYNINNCSN